MSGLDPTVVNALVAALTPDQMQSGIATALRNREIDSVEYYLLALVRVDPERAERIRRTIQVGLDIGSGQ